MFTFNPIYYTITINDNNNNNAEIKIKRMYCRGKRNLHRIEVLYACVRECSWWMEEECKVCCFISITWKVIDRICEREMVLTNVTDIFYWMYQQQRQQQSSSHSPSGSQHWKQKPEVSNLLSHYHHISTKTKLRLFW